MSAARPQLLDFTYGFDVCRPDHMSNRERRYSMIPSPTYSAFTLRVGILGLNTTRGLAGASPSPVPNFTPASDVRRMAAPIAIGADDTVAAGRATGDLLGPASAGGFVPSCAASVTAGTSVVPVGSVGTGASVSCGCASTGGGLFVGLNTFLGGMSTR